MKVSELVPDESLRQQIEAAARADAEAGRYNEPYAEVVGTYQRQLMLGAANFVYAQAHERRRLRIERMRGRAA